jgi:hypothetical protein
MSLVNGTPTDIGARTLATGPQSTGRTAGGAPAEAPPPRPAPVARVRLRRRRGLIAAGVALVALGALTAAYLVQAVADTSPVVAVAQSVQAGERIDRADLAVAHVTADPALRPVPAGQLDSLVGRRAAADLLAGSLLTAGAVTETVLPRAGQSLVGVAVTAAQLPAEPLLPGDRVRIVDTPAAQADPPASPPAAIPAEVVATTGLDETGTTVVDVAVPAADAPGLAARVATGRVALVLDSRER